MSKHTATVAWRLHDGDDYANGKFSRAHEWRFDGGAVVPGSPAPGMAPAPMSDAAAVDPEEAFIASLSSCHMLYFLSYAKKAGFAIASYTDDAEGDVGKLENGRLAMVSVVLRPRIVFVGDTRPTAEDIAKLHHDSHTACLIANSVTTEVTVDSPDDAAA